VRKQQLPKAAIRKTMAYLPPRHFEALLELQKVSRWPWSTILARGIEVLYEFPEFRQGVSELGSLRKVPQDQIKRVMLYLEPTHHFILCKVSEEQDWSRAATAARGLEVLYEHQDLIFKKFGCDLSHFNVDDDENA
jgi:hypothetical protein